MTQHIDTSHTNASPRIYMACLAAYNHGILHGAWIDATQEPDAIMTGIQTMLNASPIAGAEEFALHDYEDFAGLRLSEYEGIEAIHAYATFIAEHGRLGALLLAYLGNDIAVAHAMMSDDYNGCYASLADFAQELTEATTAIPESLAYYIDYAAMARDMEMSGDIITLDTAHDEIHIFWSR